IFNSETDPFNPPLRIAYIWITDGANPYMLRKIGLTDAGDLQTVLNGMEAELYTEAAAGGQLPTAKERAKADRLIYLAANPGAKAIFDLSLADVETQVNALVDAIIPAATAANRTKLKR